MHQRLFDRTASPPSREDGMVVVKVDRPPPGLARGKYAWPPAAIASLGGIVVLVAATWMLWRWRRAKRTG
jgi:hypothetical protein